MTLVATLLPARRSDLVIRPIGDRGRYVIKLPGTGEFFQVGAQEHFLLIQLDGQQDAEAACQAFIDRFGEALTEEEMLQFVEMARRKGLLQGERVSPEGTPAKEVESGETAPSPAAAKSQQSILFWRTTLFDPDRLMTWLEPKLRFCWSGAFLAWSAAWIALAMVLLWINAGELVSHFKETLSWQTFVLAWLALLLVTTLHEFAHGLTCKHHGGEVHEIGFLLMYFMPCFFCNVSDAWLFKEKSKRLWVMFAGGYCEMIIWATAVFVWRMTVTDSLANYLAWVLVTVCGARTLFNFNPLLKLDGYYLLSDWLEVPNLRQRGWEYLAAHVRSLLWGAPWPVRSPNGGVLLSFGLASWLYSAVFLSLMLWAFSNYFWSRWGWLGLGAVTFLGWKSVPGLFQGFTAGEVQNMVRLRLFRTAAWLALLGAGAAALILVEVEDRSSGPLQVRAVIRAEVRAEAAGFLAEVYYDEGDRVPAGALIARLDIPDLQSRTLQKRAEVRESQAKLRLLEIGPRPEIIAEQRQRVARMKTWRDLAVKDLTNARQAYQEELGRLDQQIAQHRAEFSSAKDAYDRARGLRATGAVAVEQLEEIQRRHNVAQALLAQAQAQKRHREALGTREAIAGLDAEAELARREKDLADGQSELTLLEAGTRPEQIDAERARLARLEEEACYLDGLQQKLRVTSRVPGVIATPHLKEKRGQYLREGDLICQVEEPGALEVEITITEQDVARVLPGQLVEMKVRAVPFEVFASKVERVAPIAGKGEVHSAVTVYCKLPTAPGELRPGMTGYARIYSERRSVGEILIDRTLRLVRTEFWW